MKVHVDSDDGGRWLIGRADVPADCGPVLAIPPFGRLPPSRRGSTIGAVTHLPEGGGAPVMERAVLAAPEQLVELLPGWAPLAS